MKRVRRAASRDARQQRRTGEPKQKTQRKIDRVLADVMSKLPLRKLFAVGAIARWNSPFAADSAEILVDLSSFLVRGRSSHYLVALSMKR